MKKYLFGLGAMVVGAGLMFRKRGHENSSGFTLIELLIVIFLIGIIAFSANLLIESLPDSRRVEAQRGPEKCICSAPTLGTAIPTSQAYQRGEREGARMGVMMHCQCGKLECVTFFRGVGGSGDPQLSCHKSGGIFK